MTMAAIGDRIKQARLAAGLSLRELAEKVNLSQTAIDKYEQNKLAPSSSMLIKLAQALNVRVEYFFRSEDVELEQIEYRQHVKLTGKHKAQVLGAIKEQLERQFALNRLLPNSLPPFNLPKLPRAIDNLETVEDVALKLRQVWKLGENPIPDLIGTLEDQGIIVLLIDSGGERFNGLSAQVGGKPVIAIGSHWPGDRQRFTLAHELGHLVLKGRLAENLDEEKACDRFAGAFLAPAASVKQALGEKRRWLEPRELALLKREFGISMNAWIYRAEQSGCVNKTQAGKLHGFFRKHGWHRQEPGAPYPREQSRRFEQQVYRALAEDLINEAKAAELLNKPLVELHAQRMDGLDAAAD